MNPAATKLDKQILALLTAARKQTDPVKRGKIGDKIFQLKQKKLMNDWLSQ